MDYERTYSHEMDPGLGTTLLLIFNPLQDEWATKGHTHRNED